MTDPTTPFVGLSDDSSDERVGEFTITDGDDDITCVIDPAQVEEKKAFEIRKVGGTPQSKNSNICPKTVPIDNCGKFH